MKYFGGNGSRNWTDAIKFNLTLIKIPNFSIKIAKCNQKYFNITSTYLPDSCRVCLILTTPRYKHPRENLGKTFSEQTTNASFRGVPTISKMQT